MVHAPDLFGDDPASRAYDAHAIEVLEGLEPVRKRPGMYVGGTDERALHHLVAEVLDNAMDEAVAGHANRIEVELHADFSVTIRDNGRGIPVDPHPRFPEKSALEVILCTLHAGGKFSGKAYQTSRRAARGRRVGGERAQRPGARSRWRATASSGGRSSRAATRWGRCRRSGRRRTAAAPRVTFHPDAEIFGASHRFRPARLLRMVRSKAYLFSGVEIRWRCDPPASRPGDDVPEAATFHFPGGLSDYLAERLDGAQCYAERPFAGTGRVRRALRGRHGRLGGMGDQLDAAARSVRVVLLQHHPYAGGRHARGGLLGGALEGHPRLRRAELEPEGGADRARGRDGGRRRR